MTEVLQLWIMQSVQLRKINELQNENHMGYFKDAHMCDVYIVPSILAWLTCSCIRWVIFQMLFNFFA